MNTFEVHPEIHVQEQQQLPEFATCHECYRSFHPKCDYQFCLQLCDSCFDSVCNVREKVISVHVRAVPHKAVLF